MKKSVLIAIISITFLSVVAVSCTKTDSNYICHCEIKDASGYVISTEDHDTDHPDWGGAAVNCETTKTISAGIYTTINKTYSVSCYLQ